MVLSRLASACLQSAALGMWARSASRARTIALSTLCHSAATRGPSPASASSHDVSRFLIRAFPRQVALVHHRRRVDDRVERRQVAEPESRHRLRGQHSGRHEKPGAGRGGTKAGQEGDGPGEGESRSWQLLCWAGFGKGLGSCAAGRLQPSPGRPARRPRGPQDGRARAGHGRCRQPSRHRPRSPAPSWHSLPLLAAAWSADTADGCRRTRRHPLAAVSRCLRRSCRRRGSPSPGWTVRP